MQIIELLAATFDARGQSVSGRGLALLTEDLKDFDPVDVASALKRCRQEVKGYITLQEIMERLPKGSRVGPNEAWSIALLAQDETETVVWTQAIAECWGIARPILEAGDKVAARMAFIEAYTRLDTSSQKWFASLGTDHHKQQSAIQNGIEQGRLPQDSMKQLQAPTSNMLALTQCIDDSTLSVDKKSELLSDIRKLLES